MPVGSTLEIEAHRRQSISEALKGRPKGKRAPLSPEARQKRSAMMVRRWANLSRAELDVVGAKISASLTGKVQSETHRQANAESHRGQKDSEEIRQKKSVSAQKAYAEGRKKPVRSSHRKGVTLTDRQREKLSAALKGRSVWNKGVRTGPRDPQVVAKIANTLRGQRREITPAMAEGAKRSGAKKLGTKQSSELVLVRASGLRRAYAEGRRFVSHKAGYGKRIWYDTPYQGRVCLRSSSELQRVRTGIQERLV